MRETLYEKLGLGKPVALKADVKKLLKPEVAEKKRQARRAKEKEERKEQVKMAQIKEADILHTDTVGGSEKLTLGDLF